MLLQLTLTWGHLLFFIWVLVTLTFLLFLLFLYTKFFLFRAFIVNSFHLEWPIPAVLVSWLKSPLLHGKAFSDHSGNHPSLLFHSSFFSESSIVQFIDFLDYWLSSLLGCKSLEGSKWACFLSYFILAA